MRRWWKAALVALGGVGLSACESDAGSAAQTAADVAADSTGADDTAGAPDDTAGAPDDTAGAPDDTAGAPDDTAGAPDDTAGAPDDTAGPADTASPAPLPRVRVVLFTHIEDNTPAGEIGSNQSKTTYLKLRNRLVEVGQLAKKDGVVWVLQPDWKVLEAARTYEDDAMMASTGGKNFLLYLRDDLGVFIDPHSHENGGYNYADVAHLLELLGVGGSTVIGGHIWDPTLPEFQHWERFRGPVKGEKFPDAVWSGDILIGSGTPNHVNDPLVSGVWRPATPDTYFTDAPGANIVAIGQWHDGVPGVKALVELYKTGAVPPSDLLTASWNITPATITSADGPAVIEEGTFLPLKAMVDAGEIELTDFTSLVKDWKTDFEATVSLYKP